MMEMTAAITTQSTPRWRIVRQNVCQGLSTRKWPVAFSLALVTFGVVFMFGWNPLVHRNGSWDTGGDLWGIFRGAHYVGWGYLGGMYTSGTGIVSFPGIAVLLAPIAMLSDKLHLTESFMPYFLPRPTAALILQPVELLLTSTVIFATDALAERVRVGRRRRIWLCAFVAIVAWPLAAIWGHAEDALAMTFAIYAMIAMLDRKWAKMGWLLGVGIAMQPLVLLMVPLFLGATPRGQRIRLAARSAALPVLLVSIAFAGDASDTYRALVQQPTPPSVNHATPWVAFAPKLTSAKETTLHLASIVPGLGHAALSTGTAKAYEVVVVSGGLGRMIDFVLAVLIGVFVWRRPQPPVRLLWLAAAVLASRCMFEAVMTPYYMAPPLFLALVLVARQNPRRFWAAAILAIEVTVFAYHHLNPWIWWLTVVAGMCGIVALGYPNDLERSPQPWDLVHSDLIEASRAERAPAPLLEPALL